MSNRVHDSPLNGFRVVFSRTCQPSTELRQALRNHGVTTNTRLSSKCNFFVQSYNEDDDDRLSQARQFAVQVVPPDYIEACLKAKQVLDWHKYAYGIYTSDKFIPISHKFDLGDLQVRAVFPNIRDAAREDEEQPQTLHEFYVMDRAILSESKNSFALMAVLPMTPGKNGFANKASTRFAQRLVAAESLPTFIEAFFGISAALLSASYFDKSSIKHHYSNSTSKVDLVLEDYSYPLRARIVKRRAYLHAMDLIAILDENIPSDAFCLLAIAADEIYEADDDEPEDALQSRVLMGRATGNGSAVVSIAKCPTDKHKLEFASFLRTVAHEASHMFGLDHCTFFSCIMNAVVAENGNAKHSEKQELEEAVDYCPICVAKLQIAVPSLNLVSRYTKLAAFYEKHGLEREHQWTQQALSLLERSQVRSQIT